MILSVLSYPLWFGEVCIFSKQPNQSSTVMTQYHPSWLSRNGGMVWRICVQSRCVIPTEFSDGSIELLHLCDGSQQAYGACSYVRISSKTGSIHVQLLAAKARLTSFDVPMTHGVSHDDPDIKKVTFNMIVALTAQNNHPINQMIYYYSDYYRLRKVVDWLVRWVQSMRRGNDVNAGFIDGLKWEPHGFSVV